ncbi:hypothetical protein CEP52_017783, partial [Fusarium oligoseptatum]
MQEPTSQHRLSRTGGLRIPAPFPSCSEAHPLDSPGCKWQVEPLQLMHESNGLLRHVLDKVVDRETPFCGRKVDTIQQSVQRGHLLVLLDRRHLLHDDGYDEVKEPSGAQCPFSLGSEVEEGAQHLTLSV